MSGTFPRLFFVYDQVMWINLIKRFNRPKLHATLVSFQNWPQRLIYYQNIQGYESSIDRKVLCAKA